VFGLDAAVPHNIPADEIRSRTASDRLAQVKAVYTENPEPSFLTYGPRTRQEYLALNRRRNRVACVRRKLRAPSLHPHLPELIPMKRAANINATPGSTIGGWLLKHLPV
jgi:hypothetical protein